MIKKIKELMEKNREVLMEQGPKLSLRYSTWIVGRDRKNKMIRVGGLGGMGVGEMWFHEDENSHEREGFNEAPEMEYSGRAF